MIFLLHTLLVITLFFHLALELYAVYAKYSLAAVNRIMLGNATSNVIALMSRGALAVYGVIVSFLIENHKTDFYIYLQMVFISYALATMLAFNLQKYCLPVEANSTSIKSIVEVLKAVFLKYTKNKAENIKIINFAIYPFIGIQFIIIVLAYSAAIKYPNNRLTFVAIVPFFTMLGSLISIAYVDSKYAVLIENKSELIANILKEAVFQRFVGFFMSNILVVIVLVCTIN